MIIFNILKKYSSKVQSVNKRMKDRVVLSTRDSRRRQLILHPNYIYTQKEPPWSILFFGTDDFALQSLRKLYDKYEARKLLCRLEVVTAYDGKENAVTRFAKQHEIPIHNWPPKISLTEFHIGLVVSFGHLIPAHMIRSFPLGMLNVHGSLLPRWRGAAPIIYTLMNGDTETGVSIMKVMPKKFDIGEVLAQRKIDVNPEETMPQLRDRMSRLGADLLLDTVEKLPTILESAQPQNEQGITYAPKVTSKLSLIKWDEMTAKNVYDLQRALYELYPLTTKFMDLTVKLLDVRVLGEPASGKYPSNRIPGLVMFNKELDKLVVCCRNNSWISHHCRQCGAVVCGPCGNQKLSLPGQGGGKAVRVCLQCYDAASKVKIVSPTTESLNSKDQTRNSADSSGDDSSGDEDDSNKEANHDEPKFYGTVNSSDEK